MIKKSLDNIYEEYVLHVRKYLMSIWENVHVVEDWMQETFFRSYIYIESLPYDNLKPWLFKIAYNVYMDYLRKNRYVKIEGDKFCREAEFFL